MTELRPYQHDCIRAVLDALEGGQTRQLVTLPTGTGKTVVFADLAARARRPVLVVAHRDELLKQAAAKAVAAGVKPDTIGKVKADRNELEAGFVVASVQTLHRRLDQVPTGAFGMVVVDEAHHALATTYRKVIDYFTPRLLLGVTATPDRGDGKGLAEIFGPEPVYSYPLKQAILDGWLCRPRQWAIRSDCSLAGVHTRCGDFVTGELSRAVNTEARNRVIVESWKKHSAGRPTVAFTVDVQHAKDLAAMFGRHGLRAESIHGKTPEDERARLLADIEAHRIDVLTNCALLTEGWDCPPLSCIVMARPTKSRALYAQCIGRGLRTHPGKDNCIILDLADNSTRHRLISVFDLFGMENQDAGGRDVIETVEAEARRKQAKPHDSRRLRWDSQEVDLLPCELLEGYRPCARWHTNPATHKQLQLLQRWGAIDSKRLLTCGEASFLIHKEKSRRNSLPATGPQIWFLRQHGINGRKMSKPEAGRRIGEIKKAEETEKVGAA